MYASHQFLRSELSKTGDYEVDVNNFCLTTFFSM